MNWKRGILQLLAGGCVMINGYGAGAPPRLPAVLGDHMVLQRERPIRVWGWAEAGEQVVVSLERARAKTTAGTDGAWETSLPPMKAGGPYTMTVSGESGERALRNLLIGEVWLCSGQSNMEWPVIQSQDADREIAAADDPDIRLFMSAFTPAYRPLGDNMGAWAVCSPASVPQFSGVAYFFGRELRRRLGVPIGLVTALRSGSYVEQWFPLATLKSIPDFADDAKSLDAELAEAPRRLREQAEKEAAWLQALDPLDGGLQGKWFDAEADAAGWKTMDLPRWMDGELHQYSGIVWFRREFDAPPDMADRPLELFLGPVDDMDYTWVNGVKVGETLGAGRYMLPRRYPLAAGLVRPGRNTVTVRMLNLSHGGGLTGYRTELALRTSDAPVVSIPLAGTWRYRIGCSFTNLPPYPLFEQQAASTVLYNGIIAPLTRFPIRGAIWYQGEGNVGRAAQYGRLLPALIQGWRSVWREGEFPFLIVQLHDIGTPPDQPGPSDMAELREAQAKSLAVTNTALAVAVDTAGGDLHPKNKQDVGYRLALLAARDVYGQPVIAEGPVFRNMHAEGATIRLSFDSPGGLAVKGKEPLAGFAVAGEDRRFAWATAVIEGDSVVASSPAVPRPVAARYAWSDAPIVNLVNRDGLPARPFRTDAWER